MRGGPFAHFMPYELQELAVGDVVVAPGVLSAMPKPLRGGEREGRGSIFQQLYMVCLLQGTSQVPLLLLFYSARIWSRTRYSNKVSHSASVRSRPNPSNRHRRKAREGSVPKPRWSAASKTWRNGGGPFSSSVNRPISWYAANVEGGHIEGLR